jgi:transposase
MVERDITPVSQGRVEAMSIAPIILGIDVSQARLDCHLTPAGQSFAVANDERGHSTLITKARQSGVTLVALEATGGLELAVAARLTAAGLRLVIAQPAQVRAFAKAQGRRAKNDRLDAALIAAWAAACGQDKPPAELRYRALAEHLTYYEQISARLAQARTRRARFTQPGILKEIDSEIQDLLARKRQALRRLLDQVRARPELATKLQLLRQIKGIGPLAALTLVIRVPELGQLSRRAVASLVGLAPFDQDTGQHRGQRRIAHGRARVRRMLYPAAMAACRANTTIRPFYQRLLAAGKAKKTALIAAQRKLLTIANAVLRDALPKAPNHA